MIIDFLRYFHSLQSYRLQVVPASNLNIACDSSTRTTAVANDEMEDRTDDHNDPVKTEIVLKTLVTSEDTEIKICRV